jgi:hypothetical protein
MEAMMKHQFGAYEARIFRGICIGTLIGAVAFSIGMTGIALVVGVSWEAAIVLGAFTALWGGAGFGGMFGAITVARRHEFEEKREVPTTVDLGQSDQRLAA